MTIDEIIELLVKVRVDLTILKKSVITIIEQIDIPIKLLLKTTRKIERKNKLKKIIVI